VEFKPNILLLHINALREALFGEKDHEDEESDATKVKDKKDVPIEDMPLKGK